MSYCGPRGIPRSVFLGRVVTPGDPVWLDEDQDAALAWAELDRSVCKRCGTEHADWDPTQGGDEEAFVPWRVTDRGCYLLDAAQHNLSEDAKNNPEIGFGARFVLIPREEHPDYDPADDVESEDVALIGGGRG